MAKPITRELPRLLQVLLNTLREFKDPMLTRVAENVAFGTVPIGTKLGTDAVAALRLGTIRALEVLAMPTDDGAVELLISYGDFGEQFPGIGKKGWYTTSERDSLFLQVKGFMPNGRTMKSFEVEYFFRPCDIVGPLEYDE